MKRRCPKEKRQFKIYGSVKAFKIIAKSNEYYDLQAYRVEH